MTYNITQIDNTSNLGGWISNISNATNNLPGVVFLVILWIATFVYTTNRNLDPGESVTLTNFFMVLVSGLMYFIGIINLTPVITIIVMFFMSVAYLMFK